MRINQLLLASAITAGFLADLGGATNNELVAAIVPIPPVPVSTAIDIDTAFSQVTEQNADNITVNCKIVSRRTTVSDEAVAVFDPSADALWPGAVVQGQGLQDGVLNPINVPRSAGAITINSLQKDVAFSYGATIKNPTNTTTQDAINKLRTNIRPGTPARITAYKQRTYSLDQAALALGFSAKWLTGDVRAAFDSSTYESKTHFVVKFAQAYYSVSFAAPQSPDALFRGSVRVKDLAAYMGRGNPPAFISSITYGRLLLLEVTSSHSEEDVAAALQGAIDFGVGSSKVQLSEAHKRVLNESEMRLIVLGGAPGKGVQIIDDKDKSKALARYFTDGADFTANTPALPVAYTARYLRDNSVARISFTADYKIKTCFAPEANYSKGLIASVAELLIDGTADDDEDMSFAVKLELLGQNSEIVSENGDSRHCFYVEVPSKVGKGPKNTFFGGLTAQTTKPVFKIRVTVTASTCDGDGKNWGAPYIREIAAPFQSSNSLFGGNEGHWGLTVNLRQP